MNFEAFIKRDDIDKNYHSVAKRESSIAKGRYTEDDSDKSYDSDYLGLHNLAELDFMYRTCDADKIGQGRLFDMFRKRCVRTDKKRSRDHTLVFSGPLTKSIVDPYHTSQSKPKDEGPHIRNEVVVLVVSQYSTIECLSIKKSHQVMPQNADSYDPRLYYQVDIDDFSFFVRKKSYPTVSEAITSPSDPLDRIALVGSDVYVSELFILEFYNRMQTYDPNRLDPVFSYPMDILDIYDRQSCVANRYSHGLFKSVIDRADLATLTTLIDEYNSLRKDSEVHSDINIACAMIIDSQQKYSVMEYLILQMMRSNHMVVLQTYRHMFMLLISNNYTFIRSPMIFARVINFGNRFPSLMMILSNVKQTYPAKLQDIPSSDIIEYRISSMYHIDMYLIKTFIQADDEELFVDYITRIKMVKKLANLDSKTGRTIVDWLVHYNPQKIISTLIDTRTLLRSDIFRIIFLTESFSMLDDDIIDYIKAKAKMGNRSKEVPPDADTYIPDSDESDSESDTDKEMMNRIGESEIIEREIMEPVEDDKISNHTVSHADTQGDTVEDFDTETDALADELDEDIDAAIKKDNDDELEERLDQIEQAEKSHSEETPSEESDDSDDDMEPHNESVNDEDSEDIDPIYIKNDSESEPLTESIDPDDIIHILCTLKEVIEQGISHSFFLICQICPHILDDGFIGSMKIIDQPVRNIIHWVRSDNSLEILQLMLKFRPDIVNSRDSNNLTPLLSLAETYDPQTHQIENIIAHLLTNEADYEDTNSNGDTVLHILAKKGDTQIVNTLLRLVPSIINHQNNDMMTPIMIAAESGDESMVYTLEGGNADTSYVDRDGNTVYHYICRSGICPNSIVDNSPNNYGFRPSDYSLYCNDFYFFR